MIEWVGGWVGVCLRACVYVCTTQKVSSIRRICVVHSLKSLRTTYDITSPAVRCLKYSAIVFFELNGSDPPPVGFMP